MKAYFISISWLIAVILVQFEFGYGRHTQSRSLSTVIEQAHGNTEHLRRLLRIKKLEQQLRKRRRDSWAGDEPDEKIETSVIKLGENSPTSPHTQRSENHENSLHPGKNRENILCQGQPPENANCLIGRVSSRKQKNAYLNERRDRRFPSYRKKFKKSKRNKIKRNKESKVNNTEINKKKLDTDNREDNIRKMKEYLNRVMLKVRPDMNNISKSIQADSYPGTAEDFNSLPELKTLWHDIKYLRKYTNVLKENAKQNNYTTLKKIKVTETEPTTSKTTQSEEISTTAATEPATMSVNVPKTARSHIVPLNKDTSLLSDKILWLGVAVGSGFSTIMFILCCCFYKCLLHYRSRVGVPLKDALGLLKSSGEGDRSPMHIKLSHKKGEKGSSQYVVSIMGKNELDLDSGSEEEEEVFNRSAVNSNGNSPMVNRFSSQSTPVKAKKPILQ